jgi:putative oxidoreductase
VTLRTDSGYRGRYLNAHDALFLFAGFAKLTGQQMMVDEFATLPGGQALRHFTGLLELAGGVAVLIPSVSGLGALVLLVVDVGAFFAQTLFLHKDWIHTIVIGAILVALVYLQRGAVRERLGM